MKIAHVSDFYLPRPGGIERQIHDLANRQRQQGHAVQIVTSIVGGPGHASGVDVLRPPRRGRRTSTRVCWEWSARGRDSVLAGEYDVVHLHASTLSPLAMLTAASTARAGIPTALTLHSVLAGSSSFYRAADAALQWSRWPIAWSAVSSAAALPLQRLVGPANPVSILANGVDEEAWQLRYRPERDPTRVVVASVGRLVERKRPHQLLQMLGLARARLAPHIRLEAIIIGEGPLRRSLQRTLDRQKMGSWVQLAGASSHRQIKGIYEDVDFYIAPAKLESFGIAALEARCAGLPVVAYAESGIADFIRHNLEGLLATDDEDMTASIVRLATSASTLARLRANNAATRPTISWTQSLHQSDVLYDRAGYLAATSLARRPARPAWA